MLLAHFYMNLVLHYQSLLRVFEYLTYDGFSISLSTICWSFGTTFSTKPPPIKYPRSTVPINRLKSSVILLYEIAFCLEVPITLLFWLVINPGNATSKPFCS